MTKRQSVGFAEGITIGMSKRNSNSRQKYFDWNKAAQLILEKKPTLAEAGLAEDWSYTGGEIYKEGKPITDTYVYLSSDWATPIVVLDGIEIDCYTYDEPNGFGSEKIWPTSALNILKGN